MKMITELIWLFHEFFLRKHVRKVKYFLILVFVLGLIFSEEERPKALRDFILSLF